MYNRTTPEIFERLVQPTDAEGILLACRAGRGDDSGPVAVQNVVAAVVAAR
jgi:hypothetical protein